jgi:predicted RNA binding protein YcfA (HicA-like mRNA interferase family)
MKKEKLAKLILEKRLEKSWQVEYEEVSHECEEKALDHICEHIKVKEDLINDLYVQAYQIQHQLNNIDIIDIEVNEGIDIINKIMDKFEPLEDEYFKNIEKVKDNFFQTGLKIRELSERVLRASAFHVINSTDRMLLTKKSLDFKHKMANMATSFGYDELLEGDNIFRYIRDDLQTMFRILNKRLTKEAKEALREAEQMKKQRQKHSKIFNYKDMCKYAVEQGYEFCRQGATDHRIYKYAETGKIVVIPTHDDLGELAEIIKKQIRENKVA